MSTTHFSAPAPVTLLLLAATSSATASTYGAELQGFTYPQPIESFNFSSQGQTLKMAYMDVAPKGKPNGQTAVLLHGKNFCAATWDQTITELSDAGYRVVARSEE